MNLKRLFTFGLDPQTRVYVCGSLAHPLRSIYRLCRGLSVDDDFAAREMLRNLALSLPDRVAQTYREELDFLIRFPRDVYNMFPYEMDRRTCTLESGWDCQVRLPFVVHEGRRFYGPRDMTVEECERSYRYFTEEEGLLGRGWRAKSPHAYTDRDFGVAEGDVLIDIGCSDALFAFHHVEKVKRLYLFESWSRWKPALEASFSAYREKTVILDKFVTDHTQGKNVRLADAVDESAGTSYFIKMDVEGGERAILQSSREFLSKNKVKLSCCVYHRQDDAEVIEKMLVDWGFACRYSEGYMLPLINGIQFPYFRHGVIYAQNF